VVVFVVHRSMDYWLAQIDEEKHRNYGEHKAYVNPWEIDLQDAIATKWAKWIPEVPARKFFSIRNLAFAQTLNVLIDTRVHLEFDFVSLDHLHNLGLLLSNARIVGSNFPQVLMDVVFHIIIIKKRFCS
jgi:hypothetical protein